MKCLETEKLISYAYRWIDEAAASEVRAHLGVCPRCREMVEEYGRLDALLGGWKATEPTSGFDARVRQALESQQARRSAWGFWGWGWTRGLALASIGVLILAGVVWVSQSHHSVSDSPRVAMRAPRRATGASAPTPAPVALPHEQAGTAHAGVRPVSAVPEIKSATAILNEDRDTQALEDYDLAANFDVLSELPKGEPRVAN
jgi:anti-sigma factor RsiW